MKTNHSSCTAILVGKKATMDGSTIIARNEDGYGAIGPKKFIVHAARHGQPDTYTSVTTGVKIDLPADALRYTAEPSVPTDEGLYEEAGINEKTLR